MYIGMGLIYSFIFLFLLWNENGKRERGEQDEVVIGVNDKQDEAKGGVLKGELVELGPLGARV